MKLVKKNIQNLSEALKTNLRRRKAERKNDNQEQEKTEANAIDNTINKTL